MTDNTKTVLKLLAVIAALYVAAKIAWFLMPIVVIGAVGYWAWEKFIKKT